MSGAMTVIKSRLTMSILTGTSLRSIPTIKTMQQLGLAHDVLHYANAQGYTEETDVMIYGKDL